MSTSATDPPEPPAGAARRRPSDRAAALAFAGIAALLILAVVISSRFNTTSAPPGNPSPTARPATPTTVPATATARPAPTATDAPDVPIGPLNAPLPQAGVSLVEDPSNPRHLVAGINDYNAPQGMSVSVSDDGGRTWRQAPLPRIPQQRVGDPLLAYGPGGVLYLAGTGYDIDRAKSQQTIHLAINLFRSSDGGRHWTWLGRPSGPPPNPPIGDDFPALAIDPRGGTITLAWTRLTNGQETIAVAHSRDGGRSFSPRIYLPTRLGEGAAALVDRTGAVVAFMDLAHGSISVSTLSTTLQRTVHAAQLREIASPLPGLGFRVESYPHLALDPRTNRLYLAWASWEHNHAQILLCSSVDGGKHWSKPVVIAADKAHDSFMPAIAVSPAGVLAVSFLRRAGPSGLHYQAYLTTSLDCGRRFAPPRQLDTVASSLGAHSPTYLGDYTALAVDGTTAHPAWTDTRTGVPAIFTRTVAIPTAAGRC